MYVPVLSFTLCNEWSQNARGREQNAAGERRIYERPDQPKNEKHET